MIRKNSGFVIEDLKRQHVQAPKNRDHQVQLETHDEKCDSMFCSTKCHMGEYSGRRTPFDAVPASNINCESSNSLSISMNALPVHLYKQGAQCMMYVCMYACKVFNVTGCTLAFFFHWHFVPLRVDNANYTKHERTCTAVPNHRAAYQAQSCPAVHSCPCRTEQRMFLPPFRRGEPRCSCELSAAPSFGSRRHWLRPVKMIR